MSARDAGAEAAALDVVKRADMVRAYLKAHPLPEQGALFPGMRTERAEFYIEQIRALVYGPPRAGGAELHWWNEQMSARDRRFVCRIARADVALAAKSWIELNPIERAQMLAAFVFLAEWVESFHAPMARFKALAFEASP